MVSLTLRSKFLRYTCLLAIWLSFVAHGQNLLSDAQIDDFLAKAPKTEKDMLLTHWADLNRVDRWLRQGFVDQGEVSFLSTPTESGMLQNYGAGVYGSSHPTDSSDFGSQAVTFRIPKGTPIITGTAAETGLTELQLLDLLSRRPALNRVEDQSTWYRFAHANLAKVVRDGAATDSIGNDAKRFLSQWSRLQDLKNQHPHQGGTAESLWHLASYQDGISFARSTLVDPKNPWSQFEPEHFENYRNTRNWIYSILSSKNPPKLVTNSLLGSGGQDKTARANWVAEQIEWIKKIRQGVQGATSAEWRNNSVSAGGTDGSSKNRALLSHSEFKTLESNPFITITSNTLTDEGHHLIQYRYPDLNDLQKLLDAEILKPQQMAEIQTILSSASPTVKKQAQERLIQHLVENTLMKHFGREASHTNLTNLYRDLISIHPFHDMNGRSLRLYLEGLALASNQNVPYHFVSDFDLLIKSATYSKEVFELQPTAKQALDARIWNEAKNAIQDHRDFNISGINVPELLNPSMNGHGQTIDYSNPKVLEQIRERKWLNLLGPRHELTSPRDWTQNLIHYFNHNPASNSSQSLWTAFSKPFEDHSTTKAPNPTGFILKDEETAKIASRNQLLRDVVKEYLSSDAEVAALEINLHSLVKQLEPDSFWEDFAADETFGAELSPKHQRFFEAFVDWVVGGDPSAFKKLDEKIQRKVLAKVIKNSTEQVTTATHAANRDKALHWLTLMRAPSLLDSPLPADVTRDLSKHLLRNVQATANTLTPNTGPTDAFLSNLGFLTMSRHTLSQADQNIVANILSQASEGTMDSLMGRFQETHVRLWLSLSALETVTKSNLSESSKRSFVKAMFKRVQTFSGDVNFVNHRDFSLLEALTKVRAAVAKVVNDLGVGKEEGDETIALLNSSIESARYSFFSKGDSFLTRQAVENFQFILNKRSQGSSRALFFSIKDGGMESLLAAELFDQKNEQFMLWLWDQALTDFNTTKNPRTFVHLWNSLKATDHKRFAQTVLIRHLRLNPVAWREVPKHRLARESIQNIVKTPLDQGTTGPSQAPDRFNDLRSNAIAVDAERTKTPNRRTILLNAQYSNLPGEFYGHNYTATQELGRLPGWAVPQPDIADIKALAVIPTDKAEIDFYNLLQNANRETLVKLASWDELKWVLSQPAESAVATEYIEALQDTIIRGKIDDIPPPARGLLHWIRLRSCKAGGKCHPAWYIDNDWRKRQSWPRGFDLLTHFQHHPDISVSDWQNLNDTLDVLRILDKESDWEQMIQAAIVSARQETGGAVWNRESIEKLFEYLLSSDFESSSRVPKVLQALEDLPDDLKAKIKSKWAYKKHSVPPWINWGSKILSNSPKRTSQERSIGHFTIQELSRDSQMAQLLQNHSALVSEKTTDSLMRKLRAAKVCK